MYPDPRLEALVRALGEDDEEVRAITASGEGHPKAQGRVLRMLEALAVDRGVDPNDVFPFSRPSGDLVAGVIPVGLTEFGQPVGLGPRDCQHMLVGGRTGGGKSNFILNLLVSIWLIARLEIGCLILDRKRDCGCLVEKIPDLVLLRADQDLRWNPMQPPPGVNPRKHAQRHAGQFVQAYGLKEASRSVLVQGHQDLYQRFGVNEGSGRWPTLFDLEAWLEWKAAQNPKDRDLQGVINRIRGKLHPLLYVFGDVFACTNDHMEQIARRKVVLETDGVDGAALTYLTTGLIEWNLSYGLDNQRRGPLDYLIILEEAKRVCDRQREKYAEEASYLAEAISQVREGGVGLIAADQEVSALSRSFLVNCASIIYFAQSDGIEIRTIAESMRLTRDQADVLPSLSPGTAICRRGEGWTEPFILKVPLADVRKDLPREEIQRLNEPRLKELTHTPSHIPGPYELSRDSDDQGDRAHQRRGHPEQITWGRGLPTLYQDFLFEVVDNARMTMTEHIRALGLSGSQWSKLRYELFEKRGLVAAIRIGRSLYPYLTDAGYRALGITPKGKGEALHVGLQALGASALAMHGYEDIRIEGLRDGKAVDITAQLGKLVAFEIEVRNSEQGLENVRKDLEVGFDEVVVLSPFTKVLTAIEQACRASLDDSVLRRVKFMEMKELLK